MKLETKYLRLRILAAIAIGLNILFNMLSNYFPIAGHSVAEISDTHKTLFTPDRYAFLIWIPIYGAFLIYAISQFVPSQRNNLVYDELAIPVITVNILCSAWLVVFMMNRIGLSLFLLLANFLVSLVLVRRAHEHVHGRTNNWIVAPFNLYFGWISVALVVNLAAWLSSIGWYGGNLGEQNLTIILLFVVTASGPIYSLLAKDWIFPVVLAWGILAIGVGMSNLYPDVQNTAFICGIVLLVWGIVYAIIRFQRLRRLIQFDEHHHSYH